MNNKIKAIVAPVVEEAGKFVETAKEQVAPQDNKTAQTETKKVVEDIYKPEKESTPQEIAMKQAEDKKKEAQLRHALHQAQVAQLFNPAKPKEEPKAQELERKKKIEEFEFQEKEKKKPPPLSVQRAQKVEKYPGASG